MILKLFYLNLANMLSGKFVGLIRKETGFLADWNVILIDVESMLSQNVRYALLTS